MCGSIGFIYHDSNKQLVSAMVEILEGPYFQVPCFFAERDMVTCEIQFVYEFLENILTQNRKFVIILSEAFFKSRETRLDLMSLLYRFDRRPLCKLVFILVGGVELPYSRVAAMEYNSVAKFIRLGESQSCTVAIVRNIHHALTGNTVRINDFPLNSTKFMLGSAGSPSQNTGHSELVLPYECHVITSSQNVILGEGFQLCPADGVIGPFVVERMQVPGDIMTKVSNQHQPFASLMSCVRPAYLIRLTDARVEHDGRQKAGDKDLDITTRCQLWWLHSDTQKHYRVMYSKLESLAGGEWCDETDGTQLKYNCEVGCFELNIHKLGVYLLYELTSPPMQIELAKCSLDALSNYINTHYIRLVATVSHDKNITLRGTKLSHMCHNMTIDRPRTWHDQVIVKLPDNAVLLVTFDVKAGWRRMKIPAKFDLNKESSFSFTIPLTALCYEAKIICTSDEDEVVYKFLYQMENCPLTQSCSAFSFKDCGSLDRSFKERRLRKRLSSDELQNQISRLNRSGSTKSQPDMPTMKMSPRYNDDGVRKARSITSPVSQNKCVKALQFK